MIQIPGLIDVHAHLREPGATHKEDFDSGTQAALAGGITTVLAMPNTQPPLTTASSFEMSALGARSKAHCDYGIFAGAGPSNAESIAKLAPRAAGLKLYLDATFGDLKLDDMRLWAPHLQHWPASRPIVAHAEEETLAALLFWARIYNRPIHVAHVSRESEIQAVKAAKEAGQTVTCEVCPHHLFLSEEDAQVLGPGWCEVRPRLASKRDQQALWDNLAVIDVFATDHAPHTPEEKAGDTPPPGFPGLETILPLLLNAVHEDRLSLEDIISRMKTNPQKIFGLPDQPETQVELDLESKWEIKAENQFTRCGWTPFEGWQVFGKVIKVTLHGETVYQDGQVLSPAGFGRDVRAERNS